MLSTATAVIAGITYNFLPFTALPLYVALERIDKRLVEAGKDLYATRFTTFRKVVWPLALPGVFAAFLLTFVPAVGDYVNAELLGGPNNHMIGNLIQSEFLTNPNYPLAAAMSFILMAALLIGATIYARVLGTEDVTSRGGVGMSMRPENPALISDSVGEPNVGDSPPPKTPSSKRWTRFILPTYTALFIAVPGHPDRGDDRVRVQHAGGPLQHQVGARVAGRMAEPLLVPRPVDVARSSRWRWRSWPRSSRRSWGRSSAWRSAGTDSGARAR